METLRATYKDEEEEDDNSNSNSNSNSNTNSNSNSNSNSITDLSCLTPKEVLKEESVASEELSNEDDISNEEEKEMAKISEDEDDPDPPPKKQKHLSSLAIDHKNRSTPTPTPTAKKYKKTKGNNVWTKSKKSKGKKNTATTTPKSKSQAEDKVFITPIPRFPDKNDDALDMKICLSKVHKAERVELSEDRLTASSSKGYRMVRTTRGVTEGAWYFEIKVVNLGDTGHTRLGWSTDKGDLQAPVGYDANSFGFRDIDGSKIHKALRDKYAHHGYGEDDVIGFYIYLPQGDLYLPKDPDLVWYKGHKYICAPHPNQDPPKLVPGSEISFFKNGICQGVAFKDLYGGRYYPAASMYTLPNQPNCTVRFNFGPDFEFFPVDFGDRPIPRPMIDVPYHGVENRVVNGNPLVSTRICPMLELVREQET